MKTNLLLLLAFTATARAQVPADHVHDLSLPVSPEWPCVWPLGMGERPLANRTVVIGLHSLAHRQPLDANDTRVNATREDHAFVLGD